MNDTSLRRLLESLSDGQVHSGESLGQALGISRAAVWKQVRRAQQLGLPVSARQGSGYQLLHSLDLLDTARIQREMDTAVARQLSGIRVLFEVDSTNTHVLQQLRDAPGAPMAVLAERQTAGRGRRGRAWHSPLGAGICLTIGWHYSRGFAALEGLSLVVGLKMLEVLQALGARELVLKWPNDLLWRERKLAGILVEAQGDPAGECQVAVGIGLNVRQAELAIDQPWVDLDTVLGEGGAALPDRNALVARLLDGLVPALAQIESRGFAFYQRAWQAHDVCQGRELSLQSGTGTVEGLGLGVNEQGAYRIQTAEGVQTVSGGEISLRLRRAGAA